MIISQTDGARPAARLPARRPASTSSPSAAAPGVDDYPFVDFDFEAIGAEAARLFAGDGHRRLALAAGERDANYEDILLAESCAPRRHGWGSARTVRAAADARRAPDRGRTRGLRRAGRAPTAVLADAREPRRRRSTPTSRELGLQVGGDVSVVCTFPAHRHPRAGAGAVALRRRPRRGRHRAGGAAARAAARQPPASAAPRRRR